MTRALVIGSSAMNAWLPPRREPKDIDVFTPDEVDGVETFWWDGDVREVQPVVKTVTFYEWY